MKIEFIHTSVGYGTLTILEDINIMVEDCESVCLLGPNGIGKTTLFKSLLGYLPLLGGDIQIDGKSIKKMSSRSIANCFAYVPQAKNYSYQFSVEEIVLMGRSLYINKFSSPSKQDYEIAKKSLDALGLESMMQKKYSELSGGEQQIVLLARALAQEAEYIIMDEPASNLDFANQRKLLDIINHLRSLNKGVFMASHMPDHAFACCNKALLVRRDKRYYYGNVDDVVNSQNLSEAYGVKLQVLTTHIGDTMIKTCSLI